MKNNIKLLGFLINKSLVEKKLSATRSFLYHHLKQRGVVSDIIDVDWGGVYNKLNILKNISLQHEVWMFKKMLDVKRKEIMSSIAGNYVRDLHEDTYYNAVLQIGSMFKLHHIEKLRRLPRFSYHDNNLLSYLKSDHKMPFLKQRIHNAIRFEQEVYDKLDGIFTMTEYLRQSFIHDFNISEDKVHNIGFGHNLPEITDFEKYYDCKTILFVAKDSFKEKGGYVLLDAFKRLRKEIKGARLLIVGQLVDADIDGIENIGFIDKTNPEGEKKLTDIYKQASLFVMPSYVDATGNVFLEAMAAKVPCIGADVSAMPEIIVGNGCGMVIKTGDSIELANIIISLLRDEAALKKLGSNGFLAVKQKYNWNIVCDKFINVVHKYV